MGFSKIASTFVLAVVYGALNYGTLKVDGQKNSDTFIGAPKLKAAKIVLSNRDWLENLIHIDQENGLVYPTCAWQSEINPENTTVLWLDTNSIYQASIIWMNDIDDHWRISGDFPEVRYFSLQTYGQSGMTLDTQFDFQMITDDSKNSINPFMKRMEYRTFKQKVLPKGKWTVHITGTGKEGYPNELLGWDSTDMTNSTTAETIEEERKRKRTEESKDEVPDETFTDTSERERTREKTADESDSDDIDLDTASTTSSTDRRGDRGGGRSRGRGRKLLERDDVRTEKFMGMLIRKLQETEEGRHGDTPIDDVLNQDIDNVDMKEDDENATSRRSKDTKEDPTVQGQALIIVQRFYGKDPTISGVKDAWGNVPKPIIEHKRADEEEWKVLESCNDDVRANMLGMLQELEQVADDTDKGKNHPGHCPLSLDNWEGLAPTDFYLFGGGWEKDYPGFDDDAVFKNGDSSYLYWCESTKRMGEDYVLRIKGKLPKTPVGLYSESGKPKIHQRNKYDARYISISSVDLSLPGNTYQSFSDSDMNAFYTEKSDGEWDRQYDIIGSENIELAKACNLIDEETQMFLPFQRNGINSPEVPSIFYRELIATSTLNNEAAQSVADVKRACADNELCRDPEYSRNIMGEYYPEIEIFKCDAKTGVATKIVRE